LIAFNIAHIFISREKIYSQYFGKKRISEYSEKIKIFCQFFPAEGIVSVQKKMALGSITLISDLLSSWRDSETETGLL